MYIQGNLVGSNLRDVICSIKPCTRAHYTYSITRRSHVRDEMHRVVRRERGGEGEGKRDCIGRLVDT